MELVPLLKVRHHLVVGGALPFPIMATDGRLLLARGLALSDEGAIDDLLERGAYADVSDLASARREAYGVPPEQLPDLWRRLAERLSQALQTAGTPAFIEQLETVVTGLEALMERSADVAVFMLVQRESSSHVSLAVMRSLHAGVTTWLVAQRLGWSDGLKRCAVLSALTMNLGMHGQYDRLAHHRGPLTAAQKRMIAEHAARGAQTLRDSGVAEEDWLHAVAWHADASQPWQHDDGGPVLAQVLRTVELYGAKLSARESRPPLCADVAARQMMVGERRNPYALAVIQCFGLYPPGTCVQLVSGEQGVVTRRGGQPATPPVMVLSNREGVPLPTPFHCDLPAGTRAIDRAVPEGTLRVRVSAEGIYARQSI